MDTSPLLHGTLLGSDLGIVAGDRSKVKRARRSGRWVAAHVGFNWVGFIEAGGFCSRVLEAVALQ